MSAHSIPARTFPTFTPIAEHSLFVEFGETIDHAIHDRVVQLDRAMAANPFAGFIEAVPSYAGYLIQFDPLVTDHVIAERHARSLLNVDTGPLAEPAIREVAVCYEGEFAPDLEGVAEILGISTEAVINLHLSGRYDVFMYGFAPGYAYLAGIPEALQIPRKTTAVRGLPAGSVLIAGPQCLVSTLLMPTGWWVIGRSPTQILTEDDKRPVLFDVGDQVRFKRISRADFDAEAKK